MANIHITIKTRLNKLLALSLMCCAFGSKAQTYVNTAMTGTPAAGSYYSNTSITLNPTFSFTAAAGSSLNLYIVSPDCVPQTTAPSTAQNYILTSVPRVGGITTAAGLANRSTCELMQTVQYFDGLGRPLQTVQVKGSSLGLKDVVQPTAYDAYGREATKYLPYAATTSDGSYKTDALTGGLINFYYPGNTGTSGSQQTNGSGIVINPFPYNVTNFEASPLNRITEQGAPGNDWQIAAGHTQKIVYTTNDQSSTFSTTPGAANQGSRIVVLYNVSAINADQSRTLTVNGTYGPGQLYVTIAKDENWSSAADGCTNTTEEYMDKEGHVVLKRTYNYNAVTNKIEELSTYYVYDYLGNLAFVLPPGALPDGAITSAANPGTLNNLCYQYRYDSRNRLTQKKLPGKGWDFIIYNTLDQVVMTQDANQRNQTQQWTYTKYDALGRVVITGIYVYGSAADGDPNSPSTAQLFSLQDILNNTTSSKWETRDYSSTGTGYTNVAIPQDGSASYLTINYYDDYTFSNISGLPAVFNIAPANAGQTKGLLTASQTNILGSTNMLWDVNYYDGLRRNIQTYRQHYLGGGTPNVGNYDVITSSYDFTNAVTATTRKHYNTAGLAVTIANTYFYDHMGRKTQTFEQINGGTNVLLSQLAYNEIGQLWNKKLHSENSGGSFLQNTNYAYNERGWLSMLYNPANAPGAAIAPTAQTMFTMQLGYNSGSSPQYNGNIASQQWYSYQGSLQTFNYSYDKLNRLASGVSGPMSETGIGYDLQGNIQSLKRDANTAYGYSYITGTNQLQSVSGLTTGNYVYDVNGNMKTDARTGVGLTYNLLNLPATVVKTGTGGFNITYTYDAAGQKLRKVSGTNTADYIGGIQYDNLTGTNGIDFIQTEEGRATRRTDGTYRYDYDLADHLDNTRVSFFKDPNTQVAAVMQADNYYPFGMRSVSVGGTNHYLYNKKELQDETGDYDYGARFYDPVIARWTSVDPLAEKERRFSPYNYVADDPIKNFDPDGQRPYPIHVRSFAPFKQFGGWFRGDNRSYSTALGKGEGGDIRSKGQHVFTVDPTAGKFNAGYVWANESYHPWRGAKTAIPSATITGFNSKRDKNGNSTTTFTENMASANPLVSHSPDIDVHTKFTLTENVKAGTLGVNVQQTGDGFPSAETFIGDSKGNQLFIGVSPAHAGGALGPYLMLPFDLDRSMMNANFTITMDPNGVFTGVKQGDVTYTPKQWNELKQLKSVVK